MKLKTKISATVIAVFILFSHVAFAQKDTTSFKKNAIYLEGLGNAGIGLYSLNYERRLVENKTGFITTRIGMCYRGHGVFGPLLINQVFNKNENYHFELGAGVIYGIYQNSKTEKMYFMIFGATANFMYRYQKPVGRFIFRAGWTPMFLLDDFPKEPFITIVYLLFPGISVGYAF